MIKNLNDIKYFNSHVKSLLIFENEENKITSTPKTNYSKVKPSSVENPIMLKLSKDLCSALDIDYDEILSKDNIKETISILSGNSVSQNSIPISHCYCGYQFGNFAGQLGDGRAISIGDFYSNDQQLWEIQLKGAGQTPYSRFADGRAVLRSSIREYFASECLYEAGIPTTRALSLINSDSVVLRDPEYNGKAIYEKCAIVSRVAPSFMRFGSFEIFKEVDSLTQSSGPSYGMKDEMLPIMIQYLLDYHYVEINKLPYETKFIKLIETIIKRTSIMVASWQAYGFCHGVLNTDNMSILGITIDYGPFGTIENYDRFYISNSSDKTGRYAFYQQPEVCKWNLNKLKESFDPYIKSSLFEQLLNSHYDKTYSLYFNNLMTMKLGFIMKSKEIEILINDLLELLQDYSFDLTMFMRNIYYLILGEKTETEKFISNIINFYSVEYERMLMKSKPALSKDKLNKLLDLYEVNPYYLLSLGVDKSFLSFQSEKVKYNEAFLKDHSNKVEYNENRVKRLSNWIEMFIKNHKYENSIILDCKVNKKEYLAEINLQNEYLFEFPLPNAIFKNVLLENQEKISSLFSNEIDENKLISTKLSIVNSLNPKFTIRRSTLQEVISQAEQNDYSLLNEAFSVLIKPFEEQSELEFMNSCYDLDRKKKCDINLSCSS